MEPALTGAIGMILPAPCAAITRMAVFGVTGNPNATMKQASPPSLISRLSACQLATPKTYWRGLRRIANPGATSPPIADARPNPPQEHDNTARDDRRRDRRQKRVDDDERDIELGQIRPGHRHGNEAVGQRPQYKCHTAEAVEQCLGNEARDQRRVARLGHPAVHHVQLRKVAATRRKHGI